MVWAHGEHSAEAVDRLFPVVAEPTQWKLELLSAHDAVAQSLARAAQARKPLVIADTQDNPGAGGDSNTTGLLHALLQQDAGKKFPGQIALGLMFDPQAAQAAAAAGVGAIISITLGAAVPTFTGQNSDPPVGGQFSGATGKQLGLGRSNCADAPGAARTAAPSGTCQKPRAACIRVVVAASSGRAVQASAASTGTGQGQGLIPVDRSSQSPRTPPCSTAAASTPPP